MLILIIFFLTIKDKNPQNFLGKGLKGQFLGMNIKQKVRSKTGQMNIFFWSQ